jgi:hypothetical protein
MKPGRRYSSSSGSFCEVDISASHTPGAARIKWFGREYSVSMVRIISISSISLILRRPPKRAASSG